MRVWRGMLHSVRFGAARLQSVMNPTDFRGRLDRGEMMKGGDSLRR